MCTDALSCWKTSGGLQNFRTNGINFFVKTCWYSSGDENWYEIELKASHTISVPPSSFLFEKYSFFVNIMPIAWNPIGPVQGKLRFVGKYSLNGEAGKKQIIPIINIVRIRIAIHLSYRISASFQSREMFLGQNPIAWSYLHDWDGSDTLSLTIWLFDMRRTLSHPLYDDPMNIQAQFPSYNITTFLRIWQENGKFFF